MEVVVLLVRGEGKSRTREQGFGESSSQLCNALQPSLSLQEERNLFLFYAPNT